MAPAVVTHPGARPTKEDFVSNASVPKERERMHLVLREAEERFRHELLDTEERLLLHDRILRLKKKLAAALANA